jgi:hypothetical protein
MLSVNKALLLLQLLTMSLYNYYTKIHITHINKINNHQKTANQYLINNLPPNVKKALSSFFTTGTSFLFASTTIFSSTSDTVGGTTLGTIFLGIRSFKLSSHAEEDSPKSSTSYSIRSRHKSGCFYYQRYLAQ